MLFLIMVGNIDKALLRSGAHRWRHVRIEISDFVMRTLS